MTKPKPAQPTCLQGFEHINRYWDRTLQRWVAKIKPGEFYVTTDPDEIIVTTLGSCISACIRDKQTGIGGMNHFMLPQTGQGGALGINSMATRYGHHAMEHLINEILKAGGTKQNLELKLTGGGKILKNISDIGQQNIDFVLNYVKIEGIELAASDLGDIYPRKVMYFPYSGKLRVKRLKSIHNDTLIQRDKRYADELAHPPQQGGDVELF